MNAVYGAGGFGREVMSFIENGIFVDAEKAGEKINERDVIDEAALVKAGYPFTIAIADSHVRQEIAERLIEQGLKALLVFGRNVVLGEGIEVGVGAILCANTIVTVNAKIGKFFHSNLGSYVAHDCDIGDYVTFAPFVCCNGNVKIGDYAYIGTGAMIRQGIEIGEGAVVGMGAVVVKDVAPYTTVVGNPAKVVSK